MIGSPIRPRPEAAYASKTSAHPEAAEYLDAVAAKSISNLRHAAQLDCAAGETQRSRIRDQVWTRGSLGRTNYASAAYSTPMTITAADIADAQGKVEAGASL